MNICSGATQSAPDFRAVFDAAAQAVTVPQNLFGAVQAAFGQCLAHGGAAGAFAGHQNAGRVFGNEIRLRRQQGEIAAARFAETEIVAHQQIARVQPFAQGVADEVFGFGLGAMSIETLHPNAVQAACLRQKVQFVAQGCDAAGCRLLGGTAEKFRRLRLENHGDGGKVAILCLNMQALQDMAVPCVDAVEIADG